MTASRPLPNLLDKSGLLQLETQLFVSEFSAIDERMNTCSYWLDFASFGGDAVAFRQIKTATISPSKSSRPLQINSGTFCH